MIKGKFCNSQIICSIRAVEVCLLHLDENLHNLMDAVMTVYNKIILIYTRASPSDNCGIPHLLCRSNFGL